ncbi:APC family permease [Reyranella soli]|uniref:Amino acid permease n=1 Tax=Reyranella soli TaxID=1230389 RepID=A0A512NAP1_9HYPH|nr:APC family permease [Reyranella soli]GEP55841.1 amino acid permease [Reyranella soli]
MGISGIALGQSDPRIADTLRKNALGAPHIVFFVIAAAAPLTAVVGVTPAAFQLGDGPGVPVTFLLAGGLYLLFSAGFTAMSGFVMSAGGFYAYVKAGLGPVFGLAGALIALSTYTSVAAALYGLFGFFLNDLVRLNGGPDVAWWIYAVALAIVIFACGSRSIEFSGRLLGCCMVAEITILLVLSVAILVTAGPARPIAFAPFGLQAVLAPGLGVALVFVVSSFLGFEATAIFGEEAREPRRTIPRATYIAVTLIAVFYAFTTWTISLYYGPDHIQQQAARNTATLYLDAINTLLGRPTGFLMETLLAVSLFACGLSFHNTINRYLFALGREGCLWRGFGRTHHRHHSPLVSGVAQIASAMAIVLAFALAGSDPYGVVFDWMSTFGALGILVVQAMVSLAVIAFFWRDKRGLTVWRRLIAPALSAIGLATCTVLMAANLDLVSGSKSLVVQSFPALLLLIGLAGAGLAVWIKRRISSQ